MKIDEILEFDKEKEQFISRAKFDYKNCLISSKDNTEGKTTILRSIVFGLGFAVKQISEGYDKTKPIIQIKFSTNGIKRVWTREFEENKIIKETCPKKRIWNLETESDDLAEELGFEDYKFMNDILGAIYIDQDFGWRTMNHGRIHPERNLKFNFPKLISKINGNTNSLDEEIENQISDLSKKRKSLEQLLSSFNYKKEEFSFEDKIIIKKWRDLNLRIKQCELQIKNNKKTSPEIATFLNLVNNNPILNKIIGNDKKEVLNSMQKFEERLLEDEVEELNEKLQKLKDRKKEVEPLLSNQLSFSQNFEENIEQAIETMANLTMTLTGANKDGINLGLANINKKISELKSKKRIIKNSNEKIFESIFLKIKSNVEGATKTEIGITSNKLMSWNQDPIFNGYSGAKKAFIVILTRMIILQELRDKMKIQLPFILDTIISFDPSENTLNMIYELLDFIKENVSSQIIIANVNKNMNQKIKDKLKLEEKIIKEDFHKNGKRQLALELFQE